MNKCSAVAEMGDRLATMDMNRKLGGGCAPLGQGAGSPSNTMSPGPRPTSLQSGILIHSAIWPQQTWAENCGAVVRWGRGAGPGQKIETLSPKCKFCDPTPLGECGPRFLHVCC